MLEHGYYNMDCKQGMKEFPDKYFDLAIIDPPYGIKEDGKKNACRSKLATAKAYKSYAGGGLAATRQRILRGIIQSKQKSNYLRSKSLHFTNTIRQPMLDSVGQKQRSERLCGLRTGVDFVPYGGTKIQIHMARYDPREHEKQGIPYTPEPKARSTV